MGLQQPPLGVPVLEMQPLPTHMDITEGKNKSYHCHLTIVSETFQTCKCFFPGHRTDGQIKWLTRFSVFKHVAVCLSFPSWVKLWIENYYNKQHNTRRDQESLILIHFSKIKAITSSQDILCFMKDALSFCKIGRVCSLSLLESITLATEKSS